jgi:hypothetical protein
MLKIAKLVATSGQIEYLTKASVYGFSFFLNKQVGLAVGDIDKIEQNALIDRYIMQVYLNLLGLPVVRRELQSLPTY